MSSKPTNWARAKIARGARYVRPGGVALVHIHKRQTSSCKVESYQCHSTRMRDDVRMLQDVELRSGCDGKSNSDVFKELESQFIGPTQLQRTVAPSGSDLID